MTLDIVGAGIGGLTAAIALREKSVNCRIFEQAAILKPVGAGIILANNAMQVYDRLGLRDAIEGQGNPISSMNIVDRKLVPISNIDFKRFEKKYGVRNMAIHRGKLQQILLDQLQEGVILDHKLLNIEKYESGFNLHFNKEKSYFSEYIIGADGLNSAVRNSLSTKGQIRDAKQICWRGIANYELPKSYQHQLTEAWGLGDRFGFVRIDDARVYWYALRDSEKGEELTKEDLKDQFAEYHTIVGEILHSTPAESIHKAKIEDLKPMKSWCQGSICLIGDAAHAATPNLGQGACQAIEDAYYLAKHFDQADIPASFLKFQEKRMAKAHRIVKASWRLGKVAHWSHPVAAKIRNGLMRLVPPKVSQRQSAMFFEIT